MTNDMANVKLINMANVTSKVMSNVMLNVYQKNLEQTNNRQQLEKEYTEESHRVHANNNIPAPSTKIPAAVTYVLHFKQSMHLFSIFSKKY